MAGPKPMQTEFGINHGSDMIMTSFCYSLFGLFVWQVHQYKKYSIDETTGSYLTKIKYVQFDTKFKDMLHSE